ncbi:MAG: hypothetical protein ACREDQ_01085, partial [Limisphaerales bacterium]
MTSHLPIGAAVMNRLVCEFRGSRLPRVLKYLVIGCALFTASVVCGEPPLDFMQNQIAYLAPELQGDQPQKPVMGCELSDFGSWYDIAYSGGINRFMLGSVRQGVGPDNEFFNTARDVGVLSLFIQTAAGERIFGDPEAEVTWYPYGWRTSTRHGNFEIESATFFTSFNKVAIYAKVTNIGDQTTSVTPGLFVTGRSGYDGRTDGRVTGRRAKDGRQLWFRNTRVGSKTTPELYTDTLAIGSTLGPLEVEFAPLDLTRAKPEELKSALAGAGAFGWGEATDEPALRTDAPSPARGDHRRAGQAARPTESGKTNHSALAGGLTSSLDAPAGTAVLTTKTARLKPGASLECVFIVAAAADRETAGAQCGIATKAFTKSPRLALTQVENDWNGFFSGLPKLDAPTDADTKLYYSAATALRKNRYLRECDGQLYSASLPARGGFNYYFQSDSCWNLLGYLDMKPQWAEGNAVPILVPPSEIMDPHFFWSMWELYSRLPTSQARLDFAAKVYPLLTNA